MKNNFLKKGYATLMAMFLVSVLILIASGFLSYVFNSNKISQTVIFSQKAKYLAEAGLEKAIWGLNNIENYQGELISFTDGEVEIVFQDIDLKNKKVSATAYLPNKTSPKFQRTIMMTASIDTSIASFHYGVQAGDGGVELLNNAVIDGNIFSNGSIIGSNGVVVTGDAYSAKSTGLIRNLQVNGTVHANTIEQCTIGGDAYYQNISNCSVTGQSFSNAANIPAGEMPISQETVDEWKQMALDGGIITGDLTINSATELGPKKIEGNLIVAGSQQLTLTGRVWVTGNIIFENGAIVRLADFYNGFMEVLIADGIIDVRNNVKFINNEEGGYVVVLSESNSLDPNSPAIYVKNNSDGAIYYSNYGLVHINNNAFLREVTAYKILLALNVILEYETGLANVNFSGGPGASWALKPGTYIAD